MHWWRRRVPPVTSLRPSCSTKCSQHKKSHPELHPLKQLTRYMILSFQQRSRISNSPLWGQEQGRRLDRSRWRWLRRDLFWRHEPLRDGKGGVHKKTGPTPSTTSAPKTKPALGLRMMVYNIMFESSMRTPPNSYDNLIKMCCTVDVKWEGSTRIWLHESGTRSIPFSLTLAYKTTCLLITPW